ncbi:acyl-CoA dehydrogenase [Alcanivorax sp. S71-1-4]|uniref:acyl-CoA dehydrogenase n=1 Tax=Alcanivorax sp. S71-1-4 TaxID=1177159 RepID=UPI0016AF315F|nr:acyl-CoA dehydrogenase [Alcanivorax sp. S71-1-4]KAF0810303.1 acyl-CoA dehydrogenase [Alcanivorax sp. S71-1-4]
MSDSPIMHRRHLDFLLYDVLNADALTRWPRFGDHSRDTFNAVLDLAHDLALDTFLPHNRKADLNEPRFEDGRVILIPEVKQALDAYVEAGFMSAMADSDQGGMQLPFLIDSAASACFSAANVSTFAYPMLAKGVANLLSAHGTPAQQRLYRDPIIAGRFYGTMCLSEPQAGSSLGDLRTRAIRQPEGHYLLEGAKMWISGGEHDLGENIIHLVLARLPDAPAGVRGISLFLVPKYHVHDDGSLGERNDVQLAGVNHKMGYRGTVNTFLKFGEQGRCIGYLVGRENEGLANMFHMMNEARIGVGLGATMLGYAGYLHSLEYARERTQGRHPDQKNPDAPPVPLIEHADIRRMLLQQKTWTEGAQALAFYGARLVDEKAHAPEEKIRQDAALLLDFLTPIIKAWPSEWCLRANEQAIQILGGYGYTREYPVEQFYRDNRLNPIHEGTNGIQAMDLLGRKAMMQGGAALTLLAQRITATLDTLRDNPRLQPLAVEMQGYLHLAGDTTATLGQALARGEIRLGLANASHYLTLIGHLCVGWMWLKQAQVASEKHPRASDTDADFLEGKILACEFFFRHELPIIRHSAALLKSLDDTTLKTTSAHL